jgi:hypothetical protein
MLPLVVGFPAAAVRVFLDKTIPVDAHTLAQEIHRTFMLLV